MQNLLAILVRYGNFIAFLILEGLCLILIINNNESQNKIYIGSANYFSGILNEKASDFTNYFNLAEVADSLAEENAVLLTLSNKSRYQKSFKKDTINDSFHIQQYTYIPAQVVNNSTIQHNNHLTLNKGSLHGIRPGMGIVSADGVVGIVLNVSKHFSHAMSILHRQVRISATLPRTKYFGTLLWKGNNPLFMDLEAIPKHIEITVGDTIETSGYSTIFPAGIMIGTVDTFWLPSGDNFYEINVRIKEDLGKLTYAYIVDNLLSEEQLNLESSLTDGQ